MAAIEWENLHRDAIPHYRAARAMGRRVAAFESRPKVPARLQIVVQALRDLGPTPDFAALDAWERRARDPEDRAFWILDRLQAAAEEIDKGAEDGRS